SASAVEEQFERTSAQTLARLGEGRVNGFSVIWGGMEVAPDLGDAAVGEPGLGDDQPDDLVSGQAALALAGGAGGEQDPEDGVQREQLIQRGEEMVQVGLGSCGQNAAWARRG